MPPAPPADGTPPPAQPKTATPLAWGGAVVAVGLAVVSRLLPIGLTTLLALSSLDGGGRIRPLVREPLLREYLTRFGFVDRLAYQWLFALGVLAVLIVVGLALGPTLSRLGRLRFPVLLTALLLLTTSELVLVPLIAWVWDDVGLTGVGGKAVAQYGSHAPAIYLVLKGLAYLAVAYILWPLDPDRPRSRWPLPLRIALGAWGVTVWSLGALINAWNPQPGPIELRPWEVAHLATTLQLWPMTGLMGLLIMVFSWPAILELYRQAARGDLLGDVAPPPRLRATPLTLIIGVTVLAVLLVPFYYWGRLLGSFVSYPDLWDPVIVAGRYDTRHLDEIFKTPAAATPLILPLLLNFGRALAELGLAALGAWGFLRLPGKARGMLGFLLAATVVVGIIAPGVAAAFDAATQGRTALAWPRHLLGLPLAMLALIGYARGWPSRVSGNPDTLVAPSTFPVRLLVLCFCGLFVAGYLDQTPLLLPPGVHEVPQWPTVVLVQVLSTTSYNLPSKLAYALGWHVPVWVAIVVAAIALTRGAMPQPVLTPGPSPKLDPSTVLRAGDSLGRGESEGETALLPERRQPVDSASDPPLPSESSSLGEGRGVRNA